MAYGDYEQKLKKRMLQIAGDIVVNQEFANILDVTKQTRPILEIAIAQFRKYVELQALVDHYCECFPNNPSFEDYRQKTKKSLDEMTQLLLNDLSRPYPRT